MTLVVVTRETSCVVPSTPGSVKSVTLRPTLTSAGTVMAGVSV